MIDDQGLGPSSQPSAGKPARGARDELTVNIELVLVDGAEGEILSKRQAAVVLDVLREVARRRDRQESNPSVDE